MIPQAHTLISAFLPHENFTGDFGMLCGFTASHAALSEISRTFSGDGTRPHLAAFIHPTANAITDIPGVAWMHFHETPFHLLHAKVALLGFQGPNDAYILRLLVSTGNWTQEPLTTSFDMYWCADFEIGSDDPQLCADLTASAELFAWLRGHCDTRILETTFDGQKPDHSWQDALDALPASNSKPRFFDTRSETMMDQVIDRIPKKLRAKRIILGSGYFEAPSTKGGTLISKIEKKLKSRLANDAKRDLVLNPESCQGIAKQAKKLASDGWRLRGPKSDGTTRKLHAKFMLLTAHDAPNKIGKSFLYLGSGNFSKKGFASTVRGGNLEAGLVLQPNEELTWRKGTRNNIQALLPVNLDTCVEIGSLANGNDYQEPEPPAAPPIVPFVIWKDGHIHAPDDVDTALSIEDQDGHNTSLPASWPAPAPAFVTLVPDSNHDSIQDGQKAGWKVPVYASGALVTPRPQDMTIDDIIANLKLFPAPAEPQDTEEFAYTLSDGVAAQTAAKPQEYPLREMMRLIVHLTETQRSTKPHDWARWCREISQTLPLLAKTEAAMLAPFQRAGATPLTALLGPTFIPDGADKEALDQAIRAINSAWGLSGAQDLWGPDNA